LHVFRGAPDPASLTTQFPYPLYDPNNPGWYYLRVPTLEETIYAKCTDNPCTCGDCWVNHPQWKTISLPQSPSVSNPDLWEQPYFFPDLPLTPAAARQDKWSGSLKKFVDNPRHPRAGEDVVLTNVLSFDVKVWCPIEKDFVDLGKPGTTWADDKNTIWTGDGGEPLRLPRTWDSWTRGYSVDYPEYRNGDGIVIPPYTAPLQAIQITLRCFDPASKVIKQVTVVHRFK
jgi:hypothetical protein